MYTLSGNKPTVFFALITDRVSGKGNVRLFPLCYLNRLTFERDLLHVCGS